jgi:hypothetical protein
MQNTRIAIRLVALSLLLLLALIPALAGHAQEPGGGRNGEGAGGGGRGLADPPPAGYTVLYMFTGAADDDALPDPGKRATVVHCTNYGSSSVNVRVEISDYDNNPTVDATHQIDPSHTRTFASQNTQVYTEDSLLPSPSDAIDQGSGRIMADSSSAKVICTVQVVDPANNPPEYGVKLTLYDRSGHIVGSVRKVFLPIILKG